MQNIYKYSFLTELENKYQGYFKFSKNIYLLPPILKKVGLIYYLAFLVIEKSNEIKRPIGVILINKVTLQEKVYDMSDYEFCPTKPDFDYVYYNCNLFSNYFPFRNLETIENFKVSLDKLAGASYSKFFNIDNNEYQKYLARIKKLFPQEYNIFFEELEKNEIKPVDNEILARRNFTKIKFKLQKNKIEKHQLIAEKILKKQLKKQFRNYITAFIKSKILPDLMGTGSYNKIVFYNKFGEYYKHFVKNIANNYNCYCMELDDNTRKQNILLLFEKEKNEVKKLLIESKNNTASKIDFIDSLSKVLIVFLNALLIEEIHNSVLPIFEQEIRECIEIFDSNKDKNYDAEAQQFLYKIYNGLLNDYKTASNEDLSFTYFGYFVVHFPFDL